MAYATNSVNTSQAYIGLGSNLGDSVANVRTAISELAKVGNLYACSHLYLSKPWGYLDQPDFINAVVAIETNSSPRQMLTMLQEIEKNMGRQATSIRWGPRLIDLDILTFGNWQVSEVDLIIPHPFMLERAFVLAPLSDIDKSYSAAYLTLPENLRLQIERL
jgi:2-amino-4-hydroxy-6-hydroxymethyldihydropteridine diphosphokinase